jgi:hypothetical protein
MSRWRPTMSGRSKTKAMSIDTAQDDREEIQWELFQPAVIWSW